MKKRVFIIHGWGAGPKDNWFQWAKRELESYGFEVVVPQMPDTNFPKLEQWIKIMHELIDPTDDNTLLIGHSLGTITILRYLESLGENEKVGGVILVSGFLENFGLPKELENFAENRIDFEKVKKTSNKFVIFHSDNDPLIPVSQAMMLNNKLNGKLDVIANAGHLNEGTGAGKFPELIEKLLKISK